MRKAERLDALYAKVPTFKCIPGCHACCGPVPFSAEEWARLPVKRVGQGQTCPYVSEKGCEVYEYRPFMCRIFGTYAGCACRYGRGPGLLLTRRGAGALLAEYRQIVGPGLGLRPCVGQAQLVKEKKGVVREPPLRA